MKQTTYKNLPKLKDLVRLIICARYDLLKNQSATARSLACSRGTVRKYLGL